MEKKIIISNDKVMEYVSLHNRVVTDKSKMEKIKTDFLSMGLGTYIYKGTKNITNCVTIYETHREKIVVREGCQEKYNALQAQIDALKALQAQYTETIDVVDYRAKVTKTPKGINELLKNDEF